MKQLLAILTTAVLFASILAGATGCDKEKEQEPDWSDWKTYQLTVASFRPQVQHGYFIYGFIDEAWLPRYFDIEGFDEQYVEGYEYVIKVDARYHYLPYPDCSAERVVEAKLIGIVSKTKKDSDITN